MPKELSPEDQLSAKMLELQERINALDDRCTVLRANCILKDREIAEKDERIKGAEVDIAAVRKELEEAKVLIKGFQETAALTAKDVSA